MNKNIELIIESIGKLNLLELNELVKSIEKKFKISSIDCNINEDKNKQEKKDNIKNKDSFSIILNSVGKNKISVIKVVREITNLGLKESKDLVEKTPNIIKENLTKKEADIILDKFIKIGADVKIK